MCFEPSLFVMFSLYLAGWLVFPSHRADVIKCADGTNDNLGFPLVD
jgi:hypothetical protein